MATDAPLSFIGLAEEVLQSIRKPLTAPEIWDAAQAMGLTTRLESKGKTPDRSLGAILYTDVKKAGSGFVAIGARPIRFLLSSQAGEFSEAQLVKQAAEASPKSEGAASSKLSERDTHPFLVRFAEVRFSAFCKTIKHERSEKKGEKHNQWVHPDIVAFSLPGIGWKSEVVEFSKAAAAPAARLYSFELKLELSFSTLREYFFQAVSNSSWAHEGYLVAAEIDDDVDFRAELARLSRSFGIGVIHLNLDDPIESDVLHAAEQKIELDWETIDRIAAINVDFRSFVRAVSSSIAVNQPVTKSGGFDEVLDEKKLEAILATLGHKK